MNLNVVANHVLDQGKKHFMRVLLLFCIDYLHFRNGRFAAEPLGELTSLTSEPPGPGFGIRSDL